MKTLMSLLVLSVLIASCGEDDIVQYQYTATTMMGKTTVTITKDSVITAFNGRGEPTRTSRATEPSEWTALFNSLKGIDLEKIGSLEAPTNKRATDAAPFGTLYVTTSDTTYTSATFDGKHPHEMLQPLMDEIVKVWEKK